MTKRTPLRFTILHCAQIFLTEALTFIVRLFIAVNYSPLGQIIRTHFERYLVSREETNVVDSHATRDMGQNFMTVIEPYTKSRARQGLQDLSFDANQFFVVGHILYEDFTNTEK